MVTTKTLIVSRIVDHPDRTLLYGDPSDDFYVVAPHDCPAKTGDLIRYEQTGVGLGFFVEVVPRTPVTYHDYGDDPAPIIKAMQTVSDHPALILVYESLAKLFVGRKRLSNWDVNLKIMNGLQAAYLRYNTTLDVKFPIETNLNGFAQAVMDAAEKSWNRDDPEQPAS
jgi:hypothetical protein